MACGIKLIAWANGQPYEGTRSGGPEWLKSFDFDAHDPRNVDPHPYPTGACDSTPNADEAMRFEDAGEAFAYWQRTSTVTPWRPDGEPNRPLTALTVEVLPLG